MWINNWHQGKNKIYMKAHVKNIDSESKKNIKFYLKKYTCGSLTLVDISVKWKFIT